MIISVLQTLKLKVDGAPIFAAGFKNYHSKNNPEDRRFTLGRFRLGRSPLRESHYVLTGVNDFKTAMNVSLCRKSNHAAKQAWATYMKEIDGAIKLIRTSARVMVGKW
tara:strand:+ start:810 stop:1133 length:324 start_codon:yes stop_codon:yes gene_type:complete